MEDTGEKIVFLARELLEARVPEIPVAKKITTITMTFKTLCFTTLLAAAGGTVISTYVQEHSRPLNRYEKIELQALIFYTSRIKNISEEILRQEVEKLADVDHFDDLTATAFPSVRKYLQEKAR